MAPCVQGQRIGSNSAADCGLEFCAMECCEGTPGAQRKRHETSAVKSMPPLTQFKRFDVRDLLQRGAEPLPEIRKRVDALKKEQGLIIIAPFLPSPLIEKLGSEGFASKVERGTGADWIVYFWREA